MGVKWVCVCVCVARTVKISRNNIICEFILISRALQVVRVACK